MDAAAVVVTLGAYVFTAATAGALAAATRRGEATVARDADAPLLQRPSTTAAEAALVAAGAYALHPVTLAALATRPSDVVANAVFAALYAAAASGLSLAAAVCAAYAVAVFPVQGAAIALPAAALAYRGVMQRAAAAAATADAGAGRLAARELLAGAASACCLAAGAATGALPTRAHAAPQAVAPSSHLPDLGLWWYLTALAFAGQHQQQASPLRYHAALAWLHPAAYVVPLTVRLRRRPALAFTAVLSLACLLDASAGWSLARLPLCTALLLTAPDVVQEMRHGYLWGGLAALAVAVSPLMKAQWLAPPHSGNANLLFNTQLLFAVGCGSLVAEAVAGALRLERRGRAAAAAAGRKAAAGATGAVEAAPQ